MEQPGFGTRLGLAFSLFFKVLFDAVLAGRVRGLLSGAPAPAPAKAEPAPEPKTDHGALQLLRALQAEGRFIDFVQDDITGVPDADVAAASRVVHEGCRTVVQRWFAPTPVWPGEEGANVTVEAGFDPKKVRLTGNVVGDPPFTGALAHHGWRADKNDVPTLTGGADPQIVMPAEIEL